MSFFHDSVLPHTHNVYGDGGVGLSVRQKGLRKIQSHNGLFAPLIQLVREPWATIGSAVDHFNYGLEEDSTASPEEDSRKQVLYLQLRNAESYDDWKRAATELDTLEGNDAWKAQEQSNEYDHALIAARLRQLDDARISCDLNKMLFLIRTSLTRSLGGMGDLRLYKHSHIGTKALIERYIDSAQRTLAAILDVSAKQDVGEGIDHRTLLEQLLAARQSFGRSALLLSGGGTFGMNHIGVVKSLWEAHLLPRIISGASAGSIVCAVLCTKTDAEIPQVLEDFCYGDLAVFEKEGDGDGLIKKLARFLKHGALFDISHLVRVMRDLLGDITFQEAYNRTRKILNITVSSASLYELPRLLNYVTAPNVMIWSAVCASCSVPLIFSAASLQAKDPRTGQAVPWNPTDNAGWIDGSVDNDLPMTRLAEMFNVNHFIVSQVNPHVVPFLVKEEEKIDAEAQANEGVGPGPSWLHGMANLAKGEALHRLHVLSEFGVMPNYLTKARSVLNQRYSGDITIFPAISYAHFPRVLSNPTTEYMLQCMLIGERATWPKLSRVQNHVAIELALDEAVQQLRARVAFSPSQVDLRLNVYGRPQSQDNGQGHRPRSSKSHKVTRFAHDTAPSSPTTSKTSHRPSQSRVVVTKPHLPSQSTRIYSKPSVSNTINIPASDTLSSSTAAGVSSSSSGADLGSDTDTSELLSSSPPESPSVALPTLWPSTRQLFPSTSQPNTPSIVTHTFGHRNPSSLHLAGETPTANTQPSSRETRYKRLFHPAPETARSQPSSTASQDNSSDIAKKETKRGKKEKKKAEKQKSHSRRGSAQGAGLGLLLDISGTRGMMMRRKKSSGKGAPPT